MTSSWRSSYLSRGSSTGLTWQISSTALAGKFADVGKSRFILASKYQKRSQELLSGHYRKMQSLFRLKKNLGLIGRQFYNFCQVDLFAQLKADGGVSIKILNQSRIFRKSRSQTASLTARIWTNFYTGSRLLKSLELRKTAPGSKIEASSFSVILNLSTIDYWPFNPLWHVIFTGG